MNRHRQTMIVRKRMTSIKRTVLHIALLVTLLGVPSLASAAPQTAAAPSTASTTANIQLLRRIESTIAQKKGLTPNEQKIDSNLLAEIERQAPQSLPTDRAAPEADQNAVDAAAPEFVTTVVVGEDGKVDLDIRANVNDALLNQLTTAGAEIRFTSADYRTIVARVPLDQIAALAGNADVSFIQPNAEASTDEGSLFVASATGIDFATRAANVRAQLRAALPQVVQSKAQLAPLAKVNVSQGDVAHRADLARTTFGVNGAGIKIGVLSDGVETLARAQASGDLPPNVTVLPGQSGTEAAGIQDEGTAMLEIVHDLAPGADLLFATAFGGIAQFATNIRALRAAGADIIVDDIKYFVESPLQDGQAPGVISQFNGGIVTQAVNDVSASGALHFSSAGNAGNLNDGTSGTWEGNFADGGAADPAFFGFSGTLHDFDFGSNVVAFNTITNDSTTIRAFLHWADPLGGSTNDYDLFLLNPAGTQIIARSVNVQNGTQDPIEFISGTASVSLLGFRLVVLKNIGAEDRFIHLNTNRGRTQFGTPGQTYGHSAASLGYGVAATPAGPATRPTGPVGPFPNAFSSANEVERFSSDGPRRFFFRADGTPFTPGNLLDGGGIVLQKPDITAADGVSTQADPQTSFNPFFGTSAAAPHAAAIAALVRSANPALSTADVRRVLTGTAIDIEAPGVDRDSGAGILDAYNAVAAAQLKLPVRPVLECVVDNGNGSYTARFGYKNENLFDVTIPVGAKNKFTPAPENRGQTTTFVPGRQRNTFTVTFDGRPLVWTLNGRTSTASSRSRRC
jgi:hypothetical protein